MMTACRDGNGLATYARKKKHGFRRVFKRLVIEKKLKRNR